jgi:hypothetical protein
LIPREELHFGAPAPSFLPLPLLPLRTPQFKALDPKRRAPFGLPACCPAPFQYPIGYITVLDAMQRPASAHSAVVQGDPALSPVVFGVWQGHLALFRHKSSYGKGNRISRGGTRPRGRQALDGTTRSVLVAQSFLLLEHLRTVYSATRGSRKVELLRMIWRTDIHEDEDPVPVISRMREAYNDLTGNSNSDMLDDNSLALAILMALPLSFSTIVQTFTL